MEAGGEGVQVVQAHVPDGDPQFTGLITANLASDDSPVSEPVKAKPDYVIGGAEFCGGMVQLHCLCRLLFCSVSSVTGRAAPPDRLRGGFDLFD